MDSTSSTFFQDNNENLLRRSLKLLKRLYGNDATFVMLDTLINNVGNQGKKMVEAFDKLPVYNERIKQENRSISDWFLNDYYTGISGERGSTKTYEQTSGVRNQIAKLISNSYLNRVLNPPKSSSLKQGQYVDFDGVLANGGVLAMCSAQGDLRDLGSFLGYFIILTLQSSVFRRPGNENTRRGVMLYIDEFQKYSNAGFADMLTQGRSYRVASILATQNRALIGMNNNAHEGQAFTQLVSTNARNVVIFPGANAEDAKYYSTQFGEDIVITESHSESGPAAVPKWLSLGQQHATTSYKEERKARISATDISYKVFGEAVVSLIVDNTLQRPRVAKLSWIPADLNKQAQEFIDQFMERQKYSSDIFTPESIPAAAPSLDLEDSDAPVANDDNLITLNPDMGGGAAEKPNSTPPAPTSEGTLDDVLPGDDLL
jgi:hypothetical protein